jgi:agmatine deiminase
MTDFSNSPKALGYSFPAEWVPHRATWLSWIHKEASWPGKLDKAYPALLQFIKELAQVEKVCINLENATMEAMAKTMCQMAGVNLGNVVFYHHPTNDAWCRDHGPAFLINEKASERKMVLDWGYNAWGGKYPPFDLDDDIPTKVASALDLPVRYPGIVMEGGAVEFNGSGTILTTKACLLNPNRNPHLNQKEIEQYLCEWYGQEQVLWLEDGIIGDDTDGHIDDLTRFVNRDTVLTVVESKKGDENYDILLDNLRLLEKMRLSDGSPLNIVTLPMPRPIIFEDQPLPASYANFYIANRKVIVPTFEDKNDDKALAIIQSCFVDRTVVGINSKDLIWGLGSFHCLSQQEPL